MTVAEPDRLADGSVIWVEPALTVYDSEPREAPLKSIVVLAGVRRPGEAGEVQALEDQAWPNRR